MPPSPASHQGVWRPAVVVLLLSLTLLAGCAAPKTPGDEAVRQDLPFVLDRNERVAELLAGTVVGGGEIIAVGDGGTILHSDDSGQTWQKSDVPASATLTGVSFASDAQHGWAVGHDALILATSDGGQTWQRQWQGDPMSDWFLDVCALDERRVIAIGAGGLYLTTSDGGATWMRRQMASPDLRLNRISRGPSGTLYIAGERGTILRSTDDGATWRRLLSPGTGTFYGILPLGAHTLLAYGANMAGQVYRSEDDGQTWVSLVIARHFLAVTAAKMRDGSVLLAGTPLDWRDRATGSFLVSRDGGRSFSSWSRQITDVFELLQAPDGSIVCFGTQGATIVASR